MGFELVLEEKMVASDIEVSATSAEHPRISVSF